LKINIWKETAILILISIIIVFCTLSIVMKPEAAKLAENKYTSIPQKTEAKKISANPNHTNAPVVCEQGNVTLKEYNGKVGVYSSNGTLTKVIDVLVDKLPDKDREDINSGIIISEDDLPFAIESLES